MIKLFSFETSPIVPLELIYPYSDNMDLKSTLTTFNDGFKVYVQPLCYAIKDIKINKSTLILLTSAVEIKGIFNLPQEEITLQKLEDKFGLIANKNSKYLSVDNDTNRIFANKSSLSDNGFFRFVPISEGVLSIHYKNLVLTINTTYPYSISFQAVLSDDQYNQQTFSFFIDQDNIQIRTRMIITGFPGNIFQNYLSIDPITSELKANGGDYNDYNFTIKYPASRPIQNLSNFDGTSYWVKYFSEFDNQTNNKNVEINQDTSVKNVPINLLVTVPYKTKIDVATHKMQANLSNLKNYQTPEYEYTGNKFYLQKYRIYGRVEYLDGGLEGVQLSGFPIDSVQTNPNGDYSTVVDSGWSGIVAPVLGSFMFELPSTTYTNVQQDFNTNYKVASRLS